MRDITICLTYFQSLTLANLVAALYSVRQQDVSRVHEVLVVGNNVVDSHDTLHAIAHDLAFPVPVTVQSSRHGDRALTHAWSTNVAVRAARTPWIFFTRADYLLAFDAVKQMTDVLETKPADWNGFVTGNGSHLGIGIDDCERSTWRTDGPQVLPGVEYDYTEIDAGVYLVRHEAFDLVGGLDERLTAWGHAQTEFQHRLFQAGVEFVRIPQVLFWHPAHGGEKDLDLANAQLAAVGGDLKSMWARYHGVSPYGA